MVDGFSQALWPAEGHRVILRFVTVMFSDLPAPKGVVEIEDDQLHLVGLVDYANDAVDVAEDDAEIRQHAAGTEIVDMDAFEGGVERVGLALGPVAKERGIVREQMKPVVEHLLLTQSPGDGVEVDGIHVFEPFD